MNYAYSMDNRYIVPNFIDKEGNPLSPNQWFDECNTFNGEFALVYINWKPYFIDRECNLYDYNTKQPLGINLKNTKINESKRRRNVIRLTESDLRFMVDKCLREVLYN